MLIDTFLGSSPFHGPKSLGNPGSQDPNAGGGSSGPMSLQQQQQQQQNNNKNWNPFSDMKNFAEMTEDALYDEEFDNLRENESKPNANAKKVDPFKSAPFALK